jgi:hypothetical protein
MMKIDISKLTKKLQHIVSGLDEAVSKGIQDAAEQGAQIARDHISRNGPLKTNTQAYKNSAFNQGILANTVYASWVEYGNGSSGSRIYPTKSSCLHFYVDGKEIFAKWVKTSQPKPFMGYALAFENSNMDSIVASHINNLIKGT